MAPDHGLVQFIVNPLSGRSGSDGMVQRLVRLLLTEGFQVSIARTKGPEDATRLAGEGCSAGACLIVVVGGDGTANEVVGGLSRDRPPVLLVPFGTENLLARYLGLTRDPLRLLSVVRDRREVGLDVGKMNGRQFLLVGGIGFDAEVVRRLRERRRGHITHGDYFWPTWRAFWSYEQPQVHVEADGATIFDGQGLVFVGNIPRYALGLRILSRATPSDGLLDVCALECSWQGPLFRHALNVLARRHRGARGVVYRQARRICVESKARVDIELDGEWVGSLPAVFETDGQRVRFLVPHDWRG